MTVMCLTLTNAAAIIDHQPSLRPAGRGYTRTLHPAAELTPGDLWRPDPDQDPHTVTEVTTPATGNTSRPDHPRRPVRPALQLPVRGNSSRPRSPTR